MTSEFYQTTLRELQAAHPGTEIQPVTYRVPDEVFAAQKEIEREEALKGFTSVIVVAKGGKVALARRPEQGQGWFLPGGGVELDESFKEGAEREIIEELGVRLEELDLVLIEEETFLSPSGEAAHTLLGVFAGLMPAFALPPRTQGAEEEGLEVSLFSPEKLPDDMMLTDRDKIEAFFATDDEAV